MSCRVFRADDETWEFQMSKKVRKGGACRLQPLGLIRNETTLHLNNSSIGMFGQVVYGAPKVWAAATFCTPGSIPGVGGDPWQIRQPEH
jgi:hypothetical protein